MLLQHLAHTVAGVALGDAVERGGHAGAGEAHALLGHVECMPIDGPADVLLHVPVDKPLMDATPQVKFFAPYYRERVALARNLAALPELDAMSAIAGHKVAVAGQSLAGWLMIGADGGAY